MNQFWQFWNSDLSDTVIDQIQDIASQYPISETGLGFDGSSENNDQRSCQVKWLPPEHYFIKDLLWYFANEANRNAFGFNINLIKDVQHTTYIDGGKYDWHIDTFWANPTMYDRKLSIIIQLSDPSEYEGGNFEIDASPIPSEFRNKGSVLVFPSFLRHRVIPITSGIRQSLVSWVEGPKFK